MSFSSGREENCYSSDFFWFENRTKKRTQTKYSSVHTVRKHQRNLKSDIMGLYPILATLNGVSNTDVQTVKTTICCCCAIARKAWSEPILLLNAKLAQ